MKDYEPITPAELSQLLSTTATTSERVEGLLRIGIPAAMLAGAIGVTSGSTLRNWVSEQSEPRVEAAIALDDLRTTVKLLLDGGVEPARTARWLTSRDPESFDSARPIDLIHDKPMEVIAAANEFVHQHPEPLAGLG